MKMEVQTASLDALAKIKFSTREIASLIKDDQWHVCQSPIQIESRQTNDELARFKRGDAMHTYSDRSEGVVPKYELPTGTKSFHLPSAYYSYTFEPLDGPVDATCPGLALYKLPDGTELYQFKSEESADPGELKLGSHFEAVGKYLQFRREFLNRRDEIQLSEPIRPDYWFDTDEDDLT